MHVAACIVVVPSCSLVVTCETSLISWNTIWCATLWYQNKKLKSWISNFSPTWLFQVAFSAGTYSFVSLVLCHIEIFVRIVLSWWPWNFCGLSVAGHIACGLYFSNYASISCTENRTLIFSTDHVFSCVWFVSTERWSFCIRRDRFMAAWWKACCMIGVYFFGAIWFSIGSKLSGSSLMDEIQFISKFRRDWEHTPTFNKLCVPPPFVHIWRRLAETNWGNMHH